MTVTIALAMIVRNEERNLANCLESVKGVVDEIVIVDTGSSDRTVEIARRYTDRIYHYPWNDDFSAARNFALDQSRSQWILSLDADEELDAATGDLRMLALTGEGRDAFFLPLHNQTGQDGESFTRFYVLRFFRNRPEYRFQGRIHEQVYVPCPEALGVAQGPVIWHKEVPVKERNRKRGRNLALLRRALDEDPANPFLQYYIGLEWLGLGRAAKALPFLWSARAGLSVNNALFGAPAVRSLVACLRALGQLDEAICVCLEDCPNMPCYADLFFDGGTLFEEKGEYEIAVRWFSEALNCGCPTSLCNHTNGTESFLSLYHLGYCHEKLGRLREARNYYERALAANPAFFYPLYQLFLLDLAEKGAVGAFERFKETERLSHPHQAAALADLFFESGCPDLACACLEKAIQGEQRPSDGSIARLARYKVYSGQFDEALSLIDSMRRTWGEISPEVAVDEIVALILKGDLKAAKARALSLWRRPNERGPAWALLNIVSLCTGDVPAGRPGKGHESAVITTLLEVVENCLRFRPSHLDNYSLACASRCNWLTGRIITYLVQFSPTACAAFLSYLQAKAAAVRRFLEHKHDKARRLFSA
ncbi:MAG: Glycosyl transferase family 2 [Clostridia bacterium 62_21]|nr:MAG: Glycosyl transferase family 2 [Clostridia bacterium 62_21]